MSDPDGPPHDLGRLIEVLDRHGVEYLMVGGVAAIGYGAERPTEDADCVVRRERANLNRGADAAATIFAMSGRGRALRFGLCRPGAVAPLAGLSLIHPHFMACSSAAVRMACVWRIVLSARRSARSPQKASRSRDVSFASGNAPSVAGTRLVACS